MGLAATLMTFGLFPLTSNDDLSYGCVEYEIQNQRSNQCFDLRLNHPMYWDENLVDDTKWAAGIQAAAVFGIFACILGVVAWGLLVSSTCLEIKPRRLMAIRILLGCASFFAFFTITAVSADVCDMALGDNNSNLDCDRRGFRIGFGGAAMMAAFVLHLFAVVATMSFDTASSEQLEKQESAPLDVEGSA